MNKLKITTVLFLVAIMCACSHKSSENLLGGDRDDHGCIASAGYRWSEVRRDCIRIWETGERLDNGDKKLYVVFGSDSTMAEVYLDDGNCVTCKRKNNTWQSQKADVRVILNNNRLTVQAYGVEYHKKVSER